MPDIDGMLDADLHDDVGVDEFYDAIRPVNGLYETIREDMGYERVSADRIYTDKQYERATSYMDVVREGDTAKWPCVLYGHAAMPE